MFTSEEKVSPDSGCESAMAQSLLEDGEEKSVPSSNRSDASAFYPAPSGSPPPAKVSAKEEEATGIQKKKTEPSRFPKDEVTHFNLYKLLVGNILKMSYLLMAHESLFLRPYK